MGELPTPSSLPSVSYFSPVQYSYSRANRMREAKMGVGDPQVAEDKTGGGMGNEENEMGDEAWVSFLFFTFSFDPLCRHMSTTFPSSYQYPPSINVTN